MPTNPIVLKRRELSGKLPCPLCGVGLPVETSKQGKPYFVCQWCGVQLFVRYSSGIDRLEQILQRLGNGPISFSAEGAERTLLTVALVNRLLLLKQARQAVEEGQQDSFAEDREFVEALLAIDAGIFRLGQQLKKLGES